MRTSLSPEGTDWRGLRRGVFSVDHGTGSGDGSHATGFPILSVDFGFHRIRGHTRLAGLPLDPRPYLAEGDIAPGGGIVGERRETAVVGLPDPGQDRKKLCSRMRSRTWGAVSITGSMGSITPE